MSHDRGCWKCGADGMSDKASCAMRNGEACAKYAVFFRADALKRRMPGVARLYCDMDGVVADFDAHHKALFGKSRERHMAGWDYIREQAPTFYRDLPEMPDMRELWNAIAPLQPIILTGSPKSVNVAANQKVEWKDAHLGKDVGIICCGAKDKRLYCRPGDVIIDDSDEYRPLWEKAGGVWVLHKSARTTILTLRLLGILP